VTVIDNAAHQLYPPERRGQQSCCPYYKSPSGGTNNRIKDVKAAALKTLDEKYEGFHS
jgi:hypothetical protein